MYGTMIWPTGPDPVPNDPSRISPAEAVAAPGAGTGAAGADPGARPPPDGGSGDEGAFGEATAVSAERPAEVAALRPGGAVCSGSTWLAPSAPFPAGLGPLDVGEAVPAESVGASGVAWAA
jgi:hypothetical protein